MSRAPAPDPDDQAACHICGKAWFGETARRAWSRHLNTKSHLLRSALSTGNLGAELLYGEGVRQFGGIEIGTPA